MTHHPLRMTGHDTTRSHGELSVVGRESLVFGHQLETAKGKKEPESSPLNATVIRAPTHPKNNPPAPWNRSEMSPRSVVYRDLRIGLRIGGLDAEDALHLLFHFGHQRGVVLEVELGVLTSLPDALRSVAVPCARLVDGPG